MDANRLANRCVYCLLILVHQILACMILTAIKIKSLPFSSFQRFSVVVVAACMVVVIMVVVVILIAVFLVIIIVHFRSSSILVTCVLEDEWNLLVI